MNGPLTPGHRSTLVALADILVPEHGRMPAASEVGIAGPLLDQVVESRPDVVPELVEILEGAAGVDLEAEVRRLERESPHALATLMLAIAGGYYMSTEVRERLNYPGQEALPLDALHDDRLEELTGAVVERGRVYRKAPQQRREPKEFSSRDL